MSRSRVDASFEEDAVLIEELPERACVVDLGSLPPELRRGKWSRPPSTLAVDFSSMSQRQEVEQTLLEIEGVDHAVMSDPQAVSI
jgi:hypothetical protein